MLNVLLNGLLGDPELVCDLLVGPALKQILNNHDLPFRQAENIFEMLDGGSWATADLLYRH